LRWAARECDLAPYEGLADEIGRVLTLRGEEPADIDCNGADLLAGVMSAWWRELRERHAGDRAALALLASARKLLRKLLHDAKTGVGP
jgi:hypothetical protein